MITKHAKEVSVVLNYDGTAQNIGLPEIALDIMKNLAYRADKLIAESGLTGRPLTITASLCIEDAQCLSDVHGYPIGATPMAARPARPVERG